MSWKPLLRRQTVSAVHYLFMLMSSQTSSAQCMLGQIQWMSSSLINSALRELSVESSSSSWGASNCYTTHKHTQRKVFRLRQLIHASKQGWVPAGKRQKTINSKHGTHTSHWDIEALQENYKQRDAEAACCPWEHWTLLTCEEFLANLNWDVFTSNHFLMFYCTVAKIHWMISC